MPSIAVLTDADVFAGTERHIADLAVALRSRGSDVTVVCPSPSPLADRMGAAGIHVFELPKRGIIDPLAVVALVRLLRSGVDIVHAHNGRMLLHASLAMVLARRTALVATQHFLQPNRLGRRGFRAWVSRALHRWVDCRVARYIAISRAVRDEMIRRGDADPALITVIPNGVTDAPPPAVERASTPRSLGLDPASRVVLCIARLSPEKDLPTLVRAMRTVHTAEPRTVCCIAGEGTQRVALEQLIRNSGLDDAVRLLGFRSDTTALMATADVFVLPSTAEPFGLVLLEAMAAGRAVVATAAGGPLEIVVDGETGLLVPPGDSVAMAAAISSLLGDDGRRTAMGEAGRARFEAEFTADRMAEATLAVYRAALAAPSAANAAASHPSFAMTREAAK